MKVVHVQRSRAYKKLWIPLSKKNVDDEVEDNTKPFARVMHKEALITSRTLYNFMVHFKKTTSELLDAIRKVIDELQLKLKF